MVTNLQKNYNRAVLRENYRKGIWPYPNIVDSGLMTYATLADTIGGVVDAEQIFTDYTFLANRQLINGRDVRNRKHVKFSPVIVTEKGTRFLLNYTNETVYKSFGINVWMVPFTDTDWRTVYTEIEL